MNPERWAQITGSFGVERGESNETSSKTALPQRSSVVTPRNKVKYVHITESAGERSDDGRVSKAMPNSSLIINESLNKTSQLERDDREAFTSGSDAGDRQTIDILKRVIKEKVEKIRIQERSILSLNSKLVQNSKKPHYEFRHSFTQTETEKAFPDKRERKCEDDREVTMKLLLDKIDCLEERMNRVAAFLENQFSPNQRFLVDRVGKSSFPLKPWTKPPSIHPKPTSSSTKREDLTRSRFTRSNGNSVGNNETGIGSMHHHPGSSNGNDHDLELRVQFLESLVAQLKSRFMKVIQIQRNVQK